MKVRFQTTFKAIAIFALSLLLCIACAIFVPQTPILAEADGVTFSAVDGYNAGGDKVNEGYEKSLDGKKTQSNFSKWCAEIANKPYIVIKASEAVIVNGYTFTVGNDNADATKGAGRNPKDWTLEGCNDFNASTKTGSWTNIVTVTNDTTMQDIDYKDYSFTVSGNQTAYQYYKFEITAVRGASATLMQLTEISLSYTMPAPVITPLDGTSGHSGEGYDNLFDGKYTSSNFSKWCLQGSTAFLIFKVETSKYLSGYSFVTGNDNQANGGRNPKTWVLYGANDYDETNKTGGTWAAVHSVTNDTVMQDVNYTQYDFDLHTPADYTYYKIEIAANHGSDVIQLAELILTFSDCLHNWQVTGVNGKTCTTVSSTMYVCSKCSERKTVLGTDYAYHDVDGDFKCKNCTQTFVKTVGGFIVSGAQENRDYSFSNGELKILTGAKITIENADKTTATDNRIYVESGVSANIVLAGVNIVSGGSAFKIADNSTGNVVITLKDGSVNTLQSGDSCAGLQKNGLNGGLTINGNTGKLIANGGNRGAGIGTSYNDAGPKFANLTINGGIIIATGGNSAAGIGCGGGYDLGSNEYTYAEANNITINGGIIIAKGGDFSAGIGTGHSRPGASVENVVISGGSVKANGGRQANFDIGQGAKLDGIPLLVPVQPTQIVNGDDENVYLLTLSNPDSADVYVDGVKQTFANHSVADETDTNLYLYLTREDHVIKIGNEETTYHCNEGSFIVCGASESVKTNDEGHWYACNYSECTVQYGYAEHVYDREVKSGHVKTAASCTVQGEYYKSCVCGKDGTETFFGEEPSHNWVQRKNTNYKKEDQNCEHGTIYYKVCSKCNDVSTETWEDGEGVGHDDTKNYVTFLKSEATCTESAVYYRQCDRCHKKLEDKTFSYGNPKGHDWQLVEDAKYLASERSCTSRTLYYFSCKTCEISAKGITQENGGPYRETFEASGESSPNHSYEWKENTDKTQHYKECSVCGDLPEDSKGVHWYMPSCGVKCHDCGLLREDKDENHNFYIYSETYDSTYHWYICHNAECDKVIYKVEHTFKDGYEFRSLEDTHWIACEVCDYRKDETACTYSETDHNSIQHWKVCSYCGNKDSSSYTDHIYDNACDTTCNDPECGYVRSVTHSESSSYSHNESTHYKTCTKCSQPINAENHTFNVRFDKTNHWQECATCGYKKDITAHTIADVQGTNKCECGYSQIKSLNFTLDGYELNKVIQQSTLTPDNENCLFDWGGYYYESWYIIADISDYLFGSYNSSSSNYIDSNNLSYYVSGKTYWVWLKFYAKESYDFEQLESVSVNGAEATTLELSRKNVSGKGEMLQVTALVCLPKLTGECTIQTFNDLSNPKIEFNVSGNVIGGNLSDFTVTYPDGVNVVDEESGYQIVENDIAQYAAIIVDEDGNELKSEGTVSERVKYSLHILMMAKQNCLLYGLTEDMITVNMVNGNAVLSKFIVQHGGFSAEILFDIYLTGEHTCVFGDLVYDDTHHWASCYICGKAGDKFEHSYDMGKNVCDLCDYYAKNHTVESVSYSMSGYVYNGLVNNLVITKTTGEGVNFGGIYGYDYIVGTNIYLSSSFSSISRFEAQKDYYLGIQIDTLFGYDASGLSIDDITVSGLGKPIVINREYGLIATFKLPKLEATHAHTFGEWQTVCAPSIGKEGCTTAHKRCLTCGGCFDADDNELPSDIITPAVEGVGYVSLSLEGNIGINFYVYLNNVIPMDYIEVISPEGIYGEADGVPYVINGIKYYKITYYVAPKDYKTEINLSIEGHTVSGKCSVEEYINKFKEGENGYELVMALKDYCEAARVFFSGETATESATEVVIPDKYAGVASGADDNVTLYGSTLVLHSMVAIRAYIEYSGSSFPFRSVNGSWSWVFCYCEYEAVQGKEGVYSGYLEINGIFAKNLDKTYIIQIGGYTIKYSALSYAYAVLKDESSDAALVNLAKALYAYSNAANSFFE